MANHRYRVDFTSAARRQIRKLPDAVAHRIVRAAEGLELDPRPHRATKLTGERNTYRLREGEYRIIYRVEDARLVVLVVRVGHRRDVYRGR